MYLAKVFLTVLAGSVVFSLMVSHVLGAISDAMGEPSDWNSHATTPNLIGEYSTRHMLGSIEVTENAFWNGSYWIFELHGYELECYVQTREWRTA